MVLKKKDSTDPTPFDLLFKKNYLSSILPKDEADRIVAERIAICEKCPHFTVTRQCRICRCFMDAKTKLHTASCAANDADPPEPKRWEAVPAN